MPFFQATDAKDAHMRFVFTGSVITRPLADDATFQDVALTLRDLSNKDLGELASIVVVLKPHKDEAARVMPNQISLDLEAESDSLRL